MRLAAFAAVWVVLDALHCDKEFNYYDNYGNGFDITCQGITTGYVHLLQNITIMNEITLKLEYCRLSNITSDIFHNVERIRYLYIDNSTFAFSRASAVFEVLQKLEHLIIRNTNFFVSKPTFAGLSNLRELVLDNNNLEEMEEGTLASLIALRRLELTNNKITDLKTIPLCELSKLRELILSKNSISSLKNVHFYCRTSKKAVGINLNNQNYLLDLDNKDFFGVSDISFKLQHIDLSYNNISDLEYALTDLKNLKELNLEGNSLVRIDNKEVRSLENLERVYLSHNRLESVEEKVFDNQKHLQYLDLSYNKLGYFSLNNTPMLEYINLAHNKLDMFSLNNVNNTSHLKTLILRNNNIGEVHSFAFRKHVSLEVLDIACNSIKLHEDSLGGLFLLEELCIANNSIIDLPSLLFKNLTNLKTLDLSLNQIKTFSSDNIFKDLNNLEVLNISFNLLSELNYATIEPLKNLNVLDIAGNRLHHIQYDMIISNLPLLSVINVKSNMLSCEQLYKIIKYLKKRSISYTINEDFDYDQENVAGIYCSSEKITSHRLRYDRMSTVSYALVVLGAVLGIVLAVILIGMLLFRIHLFLKRRLYKADEFELIDE